MESLKSKRVMRIGKRFLKFLRVLNKSAKVLDESYQVGEYLVRV